jgi:hypothetical protein
MIVLQDPATLVARANWAAASVKRAKAKDFLYSKFIKN